LLGSVNFGGRSPFCFLLKSRRDYDQRARLVKEKNPKYPVELLDPQPEYVIRQLLDESVFHPVAADAQPLDERVKARGGFVVQ
jgi:hypothetical protein